MSKPMTEKREWAEFRNAGLLWWVNRALHLFGWAICFEMDDNGKITDVYPARCRYRGFYEKGEIEGFANLTNHIKEQLPEMLDDIADDDENKPECHDQGESGDGDSGE